MRDRKTRLAPDFASLNPGYDCCGPIGQVVLSNRGAGPFGLLNMVDERCGGTFENIDNAIPAKERAEFMAGYKKAAGFAVEALNKAERTIEERTGAKVGAG